MEAQKNGFFDNSTVHGIAASLFMIILIILTAGSIFSYSEKKHEKCPLDLKVCIQNGKVSFLEPLDKAYEGNEPQVIQENFRLTRINEKVGYKFRWHDRVVELNKDGIFQCSLDHATMANSMPCTRRAKKLCDVTMTGFMGGCVHFNAHDHSGNLASDENTPP